MTSIIVAGDVCPAGRVAQLSDEGNYEVVYQELKPFLDDVAYSIVNLEAPIVRGEAAPIKKSGPNLKCGPSVIKALKYAGFKGVTLANNHFYDYGEVGASSTLDELESNGFDVVGGGKNLTEATRTLYVDLNGTVFAFINCCEQEFSIATDTTGGSNPLDVISQYHAIREAREKADHIVVIVHGGVEMYQLPTPRMKKTYRFFIDSGADVVVNHHQHCFSGFEYYRGKPIVYGLGNLCFDWRGRSPIWYQGYLARLTFDKDRDSVQLTPIPYSQCEETPSIHVQQKNDAFERRLLELNAIIADDNELRNKYQQLLAQTRDSYDVLNPYANRFLFRLYLKGFLPKFMPSSRLYGILNSIRCDSHRERMLDAIEHML